MGETMSMYAAIQEVADRGCSATDRIVDELFWTTGPYSGAEATCAKCGFRNTKTKWDIGVRYVSKRMGGLLVSIVGERGYNVDGLLGHKFDYLERTCPRCGYAWREDVVGEAA